MADIQYLNYGDLQIELLALLNNLANQVQDYVNKQSWSNKRKEKFMSAYSDLMNRGILGASNNTGLWVLNVGGDDPVPLDTMSRKDKEMYQEAAYFIQQQMAALPTKASQEEEPEELKLFDASEFKKGFETHVNKTMSNGFPLQIGGTEDQWNYLDERNSEGLRGRTKRAEQLAKLLKGYSDSIDFNKYKFDETSPFKDADDFKGRIDAAIKALTETPDDINDDTQTLNALGIKASDWFNNGSGDPSGKSIILSDGTQKELSYGELAEYNKLKTELELKLKLLETAARLAKLRANQYTNFRFFGNKLNGKPLSPDKSKDGLSYLNGLALKANLTGDEQSEIVGAFKLAAKNNILLNLSKEELSRFGPRWQNNPTRLKKINGLNGLYWDSVGQRVVLPYNQSNVPTTGFLDLLNLNSPENKQALAKSLLIKQMNLPIQGSLDLSDLSNFGFDEATGNELWAVLNDIGAFVDPEAITGTAMALNAARLRDKNREGWSWERVLDWGTSLLGGLPVIGDAASVIKAGSNLVKLANKSARVGSFIAMAFSAVNMPEAWDSIKKIYDKGITSMTPQDILNITYGLMGLFAGIKTINAVNARPKSKTATEHSIEIDGQKVTLPDKATATKVSNEYKSAKNNKEASEKVIKMTEVREAAKKAGVKVTDASKVTSGSGFIRGNKVSRKLGMSKSPVKQETVNSGEVTGGSNSSFYMPSWRRNFLDNSIEVKNPLRKGFDWFLGRTPEVKPIETPKNNLQKSSTLLQNSNQLNINQLNTTIPHSKNEIRKEYRNVIEKELFSNNPLLSGEYKFENKVNPDLGLYFHVNRNNDGSGVLNFTNNINNTTIPIKFRTLKELQERIATFIKDIRTKSNNSTTKAGINHKEMGKILLDLKKKGWLKQGGTIDKQKIQQYKNFINK